MATEGLIDPSAIPIPQVKPEDLRTAASALRTDGGDISQFGQDIKSSWKGLEGIYTAPEDDLLLSAIDPVATKGDEVDEAVATAADALETFADEAERIKGRLQGLKADAEAFVADVEDDDDWREDEGKVNEHNGMNDDVLAALNEYMAAERECANKITALFGGTAFVAAAPGEEGSLGPDEQAHGYTEVPEGVETPWAKPQEYDAPWYEDAWNGVKDFGVGIVEDLGAMAGFYGENGWEGLNDWGTWWDNLKTNWGDTLAGLGSLVGLYGEDGWGVSSWSEWGGNLGNGWKEFAHAIVPWREWGDRPGYVITQSVLNIGSMAVGGVGIVKALAKGARKVGGDGSDGSNGDSDGSRQDVDMEGFQQVGDRPGNTQALQDRLDGVGVDESRMDGIDDALDEARGFESQPAPVGGGDPIDTGGDAPGGGGGGSGGGSGGDSTPDGDGVPDGESRAPEDPADTEPAGDADSDPSEDAPSTPQRPRLGGSEGPPLDGDADAEPDGSDSPPPDDSPRPDPQPDPPLDETYQPPGGDRSKGFLGTSTGDMYRVGWTDDNGYYHDGQGNTYVEPPDSLDALRRYQEIRGTDGDTAQIADNTGFDRSVLDRIKEHLFTREHVIATDPGQHRSGLFSPVDHVGTLWQKAASGELSPREAVRFRRLMIHEGVESALMERDIPYRSTHPGYYDDGRPNAGPHHFGAHDLAPGENGNMWAVTDRIGVRRPDFEISEDLSNLDQLVDHVLREIGHE
ncbi:hypothetical protein [Streptomonospora arabica]|uniref:Uncharacterized protein n=1 Tax=Streptomonospora arabica TaxID=412417 RepID=A0ABV9SRC6_9ACTN